MTQVLITIDTELSAGRQAAGLAVDDNFARSITGRTAGGDFGIGWQMDQMEARGLRGVYFIDPMPALVHGPAVVERIVAPIVGRGHEVQVHIHTEWLEWAKESPVDGRLGRNIGDFALDDQVALLGWARDALIAAGAPSPNAFRAGNYGANDDTLRALARLGMTWDTSFNADYAGRGCGISAPTDAIAPCVIEGVWEVPVAGLFDRPGHFRPAQICAISRAEMSGALTHAAHQGAHSFAVVTHSFEMLSRDRQRPNRTVMARFENMCDTIARDARLRTGGFHTLSPPDAHAPQGSRLGPNRVRTVWRQVEQALATVRYERRWRPA